MVSNTTPSGTTHLIYDTAGHVIAEANGLSGVTTREYVWLPNAQAGDPGPMSPPMQAGLSSGKLGAAEGSDDPTSPAQLISLNQPQQAIPISVTPLAVFSGVDTGSPVTYFVHADHLDRPIMMTDASKNQVWNAIYKPYGGPRSPAPRHWMRGCQASGSSSRQGWPITGTAIMMPPPRCRPKRARRAAISMRRARPTRTSTAVPEPFREPRADDFKIERDPQPHPEMIDARMVPARRPEFVGHR